MRKENSVKIPVVEKKNIFGKHFLNYVKNNLTDHMNDTTIEDVQESFSQFQLNNGRQFALLVQVWKSTCSKFKKEA